MGTRSRHEKEWVHFQQITVHESLLKFNNEHEKEFNMKTGPIGGHEFLNELP